MSNETTATSDVTVLTLDSGLRVRSYESVEQAMVAHADALRGNGWQSVIDPGTGDLRWVRAERVLVLEAEADEIGSEA